MARPQTISARQLGDFDLVLDIAILPRTSWDDRRAFTRLRTPLKRVADPILSVTGEGRSNLVKAIEKAIDDLLEANVELAGRPIDGG